MDKGIAGLLLTIVVTGCYTYKPVTTPVAPVGSTIALDLTDRGRVGLGEQIGIAARTIEGVVSSQDDSAFQLKVLSVSYLNGQRNKWSGEPLLVHKGHVTNARERNFSRSRTAIVAAGAAGGLIAFIATRGLLGSGNGPPDPPPGEPPVGQ